MSQPESNSPGSTNDPQRGVVAPALPQTPFNPLLHFSSKLLTFWAFLVVCLGGTVKSREAGLTIAEPVYYKWSPEYAFTERVNTEYFHRALVTVLTLLTLWVAFQVFARDTRGSVRKLAVALIVGLLAQAMLGALTVKYFAHAQTSIPHAVMGQTFLCLALSMAIVTSKSWLSDLQPIRCEARPSLYRLSVWVVSALALQLLLGAALRHDDQGAALHNGREFVFVWHLVAHIVGAIFVAYTVARLLFRVFRDHREQRTILLPAKVLMMLLGLQFLLGPGAAVLKVLTIEESSGPPLTRVVVATTHLAVGAVILALSVAVALGAKRFTVAISNARPENSGNSRMVGVAI